MIILSSAPQRLCHALSHLYTIACWKGESSTDSKNICATQGRIVATRNLHQSAGATALGHLSPELIPAVAGAVFNLDSTLSAEEEQSAVLPGISEVGNFSTNAASRKAVSPSSI
jgi:hypothetical protein